MWEMLAKAGVKRCYGIVGDTLNPVIDALRRNGAIEFIHVRHEEYGLFAAVADSYPFGVNFKNPNFAKVAEAMGAKGIRIEEPADVKEGLAEALAYKGGR